MTNTTEKKSISEALDMLSKDFFEAKSALEAATGLITSNLYSSEENKKHIREVEKGALIAKLVVERMERLQTTLDKLCLEAAKANNPES